MVKSPVEPHAISDKGTFLRYPSSMKRSCYSDALLAIGMALVVGYVDAAGFLRSGGMFISSVSANSTLVGVDFVQGSTRVILAGGLVVAFVGGVVAGSLLGRFAGDHRRFAVFALTAILLAAAAAFTALPMYFGLVAMALGMGAVHTVFEETDDRRRSDFPAAAAPIPMREVWFQGGRRLIFWIAVVTGAALGAAVYLTLDTIGIWLASGAVALLAITAEAVRPRQSRRPA